MITGTEILCANGHEYFCNMDSNTWAKITFFIFLTKLAFIFVEDLGKFVYVNTSCIVVAIILIFYISFDITLGTTPEPGTENFERILFGYRDFLKFFGIANFSLEGVSLIMPIRNKMKRQNRFIYYLIAVTIFDVGFSVLISDFAYKVKKNN